MENNGDDREGVRAPPEDIQTGSEKHSGFTIWGIPVEDLSVDDNECVKLKIKVKPDCNYQCSDGKWHIGKIKVDDLEAFISGLIVLSVGVDGTSDSEIIIKIASNDKYRRIKCDNLNQHILDKYVVWTNDGEYDDPQLSRLQLSLREMKVRDMLNHTKNESKQSMRMGMDLDGFVTLFVENVPLAFLLGVRYFQKLTKVCYTGVVDDE